MKLRTALLCVLVISSAFTAAITVQSQTDPKEQSLLGKGKYVPDIATFLQIGGAAPTGYSWDGKDVYFTSSMSGVSQVYRINELGWPYQLSTFSDGIDFFTLSYGGQMAVVGASVGGSEQSQLYLMDTQTGRVIQITNAPKAQFGSVIWSKDDRSIYYRSNEENDRDFFIYQMDVTTGQAHKIFGDSTGVHGANSIADLSQDGRRMIIANYAANFDDDLYLLDLTTGKFQKLTEDTTDVVYDSPTLMPDNTTIWLTCNDNPEGTTRLAKMRVGNPKVEFVADGWIDPRWDIDHVSVSRDYKYVTAVVNEDGYLRLRMREIESKKEVPSPPLEGMLDGGTFDKNGSCIVSFSSPTRAPDVWLWNPATGEQKQLTFSIYAGIDRTLFSEPQLIRYKSFDSLEIPAFLYLPKDYVKGTPIPFIVDAHGGPEGQSQPVFARNIQYLLLNGYGILAPNVRGSSGYGRTYLNMDNVRNRKKSLMDYKAAADYLVDNGYSKHGLLAIRGGSYGGYVVLGMITEYPDLFSAAANTVGIANFKTFLENTAAYRRKLREAEYGSLSDTAFLREISPIYKADKIRTPLLVVHGENDPRVPVGEARQIIEAVRKNGGIVDSLIFPDEGHGSSKRVNIIAEYRKQVEFFNSHLKMADMKTPSKEN